MNPIILKTFKGRVPRISEKLLPETYAQVATNCDLSRGKIEPLKAMSAIKSITAGTRNLIRINRDLPVSNNYAWISAGPDYPNASFVRAQISDSDNRIYATADNASYPRQMNSTRYAAGLGWARLGVIAPVDALDIATVGSPASGTTVIATITGCSIDTAGEPNITLPAEHSYTFKVDDIVEITESSELNNGTYALTSWGDTMLQVDRNFLETDASCTVTISRSEKAAVDATVSYVYTRVVKWLNGSGEVIQEEESAPSEPSPVVDIYDGQGTRLTGFVKGTYNDVTHYRIYRLESGTGGGAEYQYLGEITVAETEFVDGTATGDDTYELLTAGDDILETTDWTPPPDDLEGLTQFANGILAGFVGNKLYLSEPWVGYAWPDGYSMLFDYDIVALAVFNESLLVLTEAFPYVVTGTDPESMSQTILPYEQACVSRDGVCVSNVGVFYPTPDGLFLLTASGGDLITKKVYTKSQWAALGPSNLISFFYDDCYYGFFRGTGTGFYFNFKEDPYIVDISISGASITGGFLDPEDDTLYLVNGSSLSAWGASSSKLSYTWKSGVYRSGELANYACAAVVADGSITFTLFADGATKLTKTVSSGEMFRLPAGYRAREFEFSLAGSYTAHSAAIGQHSAELY